MDLQRKFNVVASDTNKICVSKLIFLNVHETMHSKFSHPAMSFATFFSRFFYFNFERSVFCESIFTEIPLNSLIASSIFGVI